MPEIFKVCGITSVADAIRRPAVLGNVHDRADEVRAEPARPHHVQIARPDSRQVHRRREVAQTQQDAAVAAEHAQLDLAVVAALVGVDDDVLAGLAERQRDVLGDDRADNLALVDPALALAGEVKVADAEEEAQDVAVSGVAKRAQQRGGGELLLLVDVDVNDVMDVDGEFDP